MKNYILWILGIYLVWKILHWFPSFNRAKLRPSSLSIYYGAPGSGKTTFAAWLAAVSFKSNIPVYSNVPILGTMSIDRSDLGKFSITDGLVIIDEAGLEFNNRNTNSFSRSSGEQNLLEWFKKHRHEGCEVVVFSQGFDDMDKKIRTLATNLYLIRPSLIPGCIVRKTIRKRPGIDEYTHKPDDLYDIVRFSGKRIWARSVWNTFDSFDRMDLPVKMFHRYGEDDHDDVDRFNLRLL